MGFFGEIVFGNNLVYWFLVLQIKYDLPLPDTLNEPEELTEGEEWLCLSKSGFMWKDDDFKCPYANPTYSSKHTPKREEAIGNRVSLCF